MKSLMLAVAMFACTAQAQTFVAGNNGGGQIVRAAAEIGKSMQ